jgi:flagellin-like protein
LRISTKRRKAISPVLATVILIAITLIAAIAIAGFVFGLFGSFTSSANVSATALACYTNPGNHTAYCELNVQNTGTSNAAVTAASIKIAGITTAVATFNPAVPATITAGGASVHLWVHMAAAVQGGVAGSQVSGSLTMSNGASVPFTGVWS